MKRKATPKQLRALAKGRKKRKANLRKARKGKRKRSVKRAKPIKKRRRGFSLRTNTDMSKLTGGTGDVNPQFYTGLITMAATDTDEVKAYLAPVSKGIFTKAGRATVMEILAVYSELPGFPLAVAGALSQTRAIYFATTDGIKSSIGDPGVFAGFSSQKQSAFTALGSYAATFDNMYIWDLTDQAGHGFLLASDYFYVTVNTRSYTPAVGTFAFKVMYRYKNVSLTEYIGIVQSQQ